MRRLLISALLLRVCCPPYLRAQEPELYMGSEFALLRFYRGYLPSFLTAGIVAGAQWEIFHSGEAHSLRTWAELHLSYVARNFPPTIYPGGTAGLGWRINIPLRHQYYLQGNLGIDAYRFRYIDLGGTSIQDQQVRPICLIEIGSYTFSGNVFVRYGFYPISSSTAKYLFALGVYMN
ncbi:MAG: hypothetical protein NZ580_03240 [Bacteroidia bacterium]|nr:hypothetical protein [Bacteroidia bacterium]MDW8235596.1 hypothetical protein [Bacteroidia bacterium]